MKIAMTLAVAAATVSGCVSPSTPPHALEVATPQRAVDAATAPPEAISIATWNFGWLAEAPATPAVLAECDALRRQLLGAQGLHKKPIDRARLLDRSPKWRATPCSRELRTAEDYAALAEVASALDADIVAVQEVESAAALRRVFGDAYEVHVSAQPDTVQRTGFAWRRQLSERGWSIERLGDFTGIALEYGADAEARRLRAGAQVAMTGPDGRRIVLMSVHLKASCPLGTPTGGQSTRSDCATVHKQIEILNREWVRRLGPAETAVLVGDFNTQFVSWTRLAPGAAVPRERMLHVVCSAGGDDCDDRQVRVAEMRPSWSALTGGRSAYAISADLRPGRPCIDDCPRSDADLGWLRPALCHWSIPHSRRAAYIDHVVVFGAAAQHLPRASFRELTYEDRRWSRHYRSENDRFALSDHCPIRVEVGL